MGREERGWGEAGGGGDQGIGDGNWAVSCPVGIHWGACGRPPSPLPPCRGCRRVARTSRGEAYPPPLRFPPPNGGRARREWARRP